MTAVIIPHPGRYDLVIDGRLLCTFSDREHAERVLKRYTVPKANREFVRVPQSARGRT